MIQKIIEICIGTDRKKNVRARLSLLLVDGENVIHEHYHSLNYGPGADLAAERAVAEAHLAMPPEQSGIPGGPWPSIPDTEWAKVVKCCTVIHTPEMLIKSSAEQDALLAQVRQKRAMVAKEVEDLHQQLEGRGAALQEKIREITALEAEVMKRRVAATAKQ
ncbi:MAG TPA: hypothetical protein VE008_07395 [Burkholderiales bacterium]|nr:hypothetical protein [Burkholderiales bacterium]